MNNRFNRIVYSESPSMEGFDVIIMNLFIEDAETKQIYNVSRSESINTSPEQKKELFAEMLREIADVISPEFTDGLESITDFGVIPIKIDPSLEDSVILVKNYLEDIRDFESVFFKIRPKKTITKPTTKMIKEIMNELKTKRDWIGTEEVEKWFEQQLNAVHKAASEFYRLKYENKIAAHKAMIELTRQRERERAVGIVEEMKKNGHGGGNWRRLIEQAVNQLKGEK